MSSALIAGAVAVALAVSAAGAALAHSPLAFVAGGALLALLGGAVVARRAMFSFGFAAFACALGAAALAWSGLATNDLTSSDGLSAFGANADTLCAALVVAALTWLALECVAARRAPLVLRLLAALVLFASAASPVGALLSGAGISAALRVPAFGALPAFANGAYLAVEILLPLAGLALFAFAGVMLARKRGGAAARYGAGALALLLVAQAGAYQAGVAGLPTVAAFEHPVISGALASSGAGAAGATSVFATPAPGTQAAAAASPAGATSTAAAPSAGSGQSVAMAAPTGCNGDDAKGGMGAAVGAVKSVTAIFGAETPSPAPAATATDDACARANAYVARLQAIRSALPPSDTDLDALAATLPSDPNALDAFVRDNVRLEAYPGMLRGAYGTWLGRAGNPTDKIMLLAALLDRAHVAYTFAHGRLSDAEVAKLRALADAAPSPLPSSTPDPQLVAALGTSESDLEAQTAAMATTVRDQMAAGVQTANQKADVLIAQMRSSGDAPAPLEPRSDWDAALRDHVWLHLASGGDLDPSAPDLAPGSHLGTALPGPGQPATSDVATLEFRVIETTSSNGKSVETTVLDATRPVADLLGSVTSVTLSVPANTTPDTLAAVQTFTPTFDSGKTTLAGTPIAVHPPGGILEGVRLEIVSAGQGRAPVTFTRAFAEHETDPLSLAAHLARSFHVAVQAEPTNASLDVRRTLDFMIAYRSLIEYGASLASDAKPHGVAGTQPYPVDLVNYFERAAAYNVALGAADGVRFAYDRPQIVMLVNAFDRKDGKMVMEQRIDIVANGMSALGADAETAFRANVARGVADTYIEGQVIDDASKRSDTPTLLRAADAQHVPLVVLDAKKRRPSGALDAIAAANLDRTFSLGQIALAPAAPVAMPSGGTDYGWWAVDPHTGATVGRMSSGAGQEMAEEDVLFYNILNNVLNVYNLGWTIVSCLTGTKAECHSALCSGVIGAFMGNLGNGLGEGLTGAKGLGYVAGGAGLGGLPGSLPSIPGAICSAAGF